MLARVRVHCRWSCGRLQRSFSFVVACCSFASERRPPQVVGTCLIDCPNVVSVTQACAEALGTATHRAQSDKRSQGGNFLGGRELTTCRPSTRRHSRPPSSRTRPPTPPEPSVAPPLPLSFFIGAQRSPGSAPLLTGCAGPQGRRPLPQHYEARGVRGRREGPRLSLQRCVGDAAACLSLRRRLFPCCHARLRSRACVWLSSVLQWPLYFSTV